MKIIESKSNPLFKKALKVVNDRKNSPDLYVVEGEKLIREAIQSGAIAEMFFKTRETSFHIPQLEQVSIEIPPMLMRELSTVVTPAEGLCIFRYKNQHDISHTLEKAKLVVILDRLQDPGNMGTIFRTCEAMGADAVILLKGSCSHLNHKVTRAAMGSSFRLPIFPAIELSDLQKSLRKLNFTSLYADMKGEKIFNFSFPAKCAIFFGQEGTGISHEIKKECAIKLAIPMLGQVESLNVATSTAICLYEWAKQQNIK